jgi:hypothetical protein
LIEGDTVKIPSLLISFADGEKIKKYLKRNSDIINGKIGPFPTLKISFEMTRPDDRVEYDVWFSSAETKALKFMNDLRQYNDKLHSKVLFTPHYVTWNCSDC